MTTRDLATIAFKTLSVWLFAAGVAGMCSALLTWTHDVGQYGTTGGILGLAAAAIYIPIGAIGWLVSDWAAQRVYPGRPEPGRLGLTRGDLYSFSSVVAPPKHAGGYCRKSNQNRRQSIEDNRNQWPSIFDRQSDRDACQAKD